MFEIFIKLQMGLFSVSDVRSENWKFHYWWK